VALGSDVAEALKYKIGDKITVTHGVSSGKAILEHADKPFTIVGILDKTATPVDRSLYVSLYGMEAVHMDWGDGAPPLPGEETPASKIRKEDLKIKQITAFLLRSKSRIDTLRLQRDINNYEDEPLQAIIPGVALSELWRTVSYAEDALQVVSFFVILVGLMGMLVSLYTSLNERRREMAILRALGAGPRRIVLLLVLESGILSAAGCVLGMVVIYAAAWISQPIVEHHFGLFLPIKAPTDLGYIYLFSTAVAGALIGFVPAVKAYRNALVDGLAIRV
jgi:putative ABC transport system permease protein